MEHQIGNGCRVACRPAKFPNGLPAGSDTHLLARQRVRSNRLLHTLAVWRSTHSTLLDARLQERSILGPKLVQVLDQLEQSTS
jgi:hypothetical protein